MNYISRRYLDSDFPSPMSIDSAITIFDDQIHGWFLDVCKKLIEDVASDLVVLMVLTAYFEMFGIFYEGKDSKNNSKKFFKKGFYQVISLVKFGTADSEPIEISEETSNKFAEVLYGEMRCGFFHAGMSSSKIGFSRDMESGPIKMGLDEAGAPQFFVFNVEILLALITAHFRNYLRVLRDPHNERQRENFRQAWNLRVKGNESLIVSAP